MHTSGSTGGVRLRALVLIVAGIETGLWLLLIWNGILTREPATRGLDRGLAILGSAVYLASGAPALLLAARGRRLRLALFLAILPIVALGALTVALGLGD